jgi:hypothetical protein
MERWIWQWGRWKDSCERYRSLVSLTYNLRAVAMACRLHPKAVDASGGNARQAASCLVGFMILQRALLAHHKGLHILRWR